MAKNSKKNLGPSEAEMLAAALTVLRLGAQPGSELARIVRTGVDPAASAEEAPKTRKVWSQDSASHQYNSIWKTTPSKCPKCEHEGMVNPDFGMRLVRGVERKQSWCADCRAHTYYYRETRVKDRKSAVHGKTSNKRG